MSDTAGEIETRLRQALEPEQFDLRDDSAKHVGHPGATSGGGHYHVKLVSAAFAGKSLVERHRMVYEALGDMMGSAIHALGLETRTPDE